MDEPACLSQSTVVPPRKRPRPVLSCVACRQKKLRCDRQRPCQQCIAAGRKAECVYISQSIPSEVSPVGQASETASREYQWRAVRSHAPVSAAMGSTRASTPSTSPGPYHAVTGVVEDLQDRVRKLEQHLKIKSKSRHAFSPAPEGDSHVGSGDTRLNQGRVKSKGNRTRYYVSGHGIALLDQVCHHRSVIWPTY